MDVSLLLEHAILSTNTEERTNAESQLNKLAEENWVNYLGLTVQVLGDDTKKTEVRQLAGLTLKNQLISKDAFKKQQQAERWVQIDPSMRQQIKDIALNTLLSNIDKVATTAAQLIAAIADIELPRGEWSDLMHIIVENTKADKPVNVKRASLLTIGFICETADPTNPAVAAQANGILIAIVQGAQSSETSDVVRKTAIGALVHSLEFIASNFEREGERNYIMQVVCEATTASDYELQALAFGALARIMSLYYSYMGIYMEKALYSLTVAGMESSNDKVACMAVEFWSTVCEEELEIALQKEEMGDSIDQSDLVSYNFALVAITDVLPTLLVLLTRQNSDPEDDDWSVAMAAGACLQLFAQNTGNYVVQPTLQFVEQNLPSPHWRNKEAAVMAFGSILDGPDRSELTLLIGQALPPILQLIGDKSLQVKETVAWCLGRIADVVVEAIDTTTMLPNVIQALVVGLKDHAKVSTNCCWTLINLVEQLCSDANDQPSTVMSPYYPTLVPVLIEISERGDNEHSARTSAYEALSSLVLFSSAGEMGIVNQIATEILGRLDQTISMRFEAQTGAIHLSGEDKAILQELQANILSLLTNVIRRVSSNIAGASDQLMEKFLKLLQVQENNSIIEEDVFIAISSIASAVDKDFEKYMASFLPFLTKALENTESPVCEAAIGLVVDVSHSLGDAFIPYCQGFMAILGNTLSNPNVRRELRPLILSCFGDIASSIGHEFIQYLQVVMNICNSAQQLEADDQSIETEDYILSVKEAVLDTYVGIVAGLHDYPDALSSYNMQMINFLMSVYTNPTMSSSDSVCRAAVGIIGDLAQIFSDGRLREFYEQDWVSDFIKKTRNNSRFSQVTKDTARWAREQQKAQLLLN
ncbi:hypothetical protein CANARDRAFT_9821 [[Candida] arabinofermentans NRRL YB-2248]|uniref:Importin-95 n=1 Tax=[Candida] arabinofermentans NRRL YB-2248 TaxID=983967 RepID=A0A1E4SUZ7_9ASCO|nr:hypothetical protein CANARDRAFT_9821 [[Candida] arabinofermentans NRRL YB-2248]